MSVDKHKLNALTYLVANISVALVPFCLMPILTRQLGPEGYGSIAMFLAILNIMAAFVGLSVHGAISRRWYDRDEIDIRRYISSCVVIILFTASLALLIVAILAEALSEKLALPPFWLKISVMVSMSSSLILVRLVTWQVQNKAANYGVLQILIAILGGVGSYILVITYLIGFEGRLWAHSIVYMGFSLICLISLVRDGLVTTECKNEYIYDALKFGVPLVPHVIGAFLLLTVDRIILNNFLGVEAVGIYMVSVQLALVLYVITDAFNKAFMPWLFTQLKDANEIANRNVVKVTYYFAAFLLSCTFVSLLIAPLIVELVAGNQFSAAAGVLPLLVLAQSFHGMYILVTNYIFFERKTYLTASITLGCGIIGVTLSYFLVQYHGMLGAAISQSIALFLLWIVTWFYANKVHPMPWFQSRVFGF